MSKKLDAWFVSNRKLKPVWKIRRESRRWTTEQFKKYEEFLLEEKITNQKLWEVYLRKCERYLRESSIELEKYDDLACTDNEIKNWLPDIDEEYTGKYAFFKPYLPSALRQLTLREKKVIKGIYWDNKTNHQLGEKLSIRRNAVQDCKEKALSKMKNYLLEIEENHKMEEDFKKGQRQTLSA